MLAMSATSGTPGLQAMLAQPGMRAMSGVQVVPAVPDVPLSLVASVLVIGLIHGAEPGHGWPVAATYALDKPSRWLAGLVAGLVIGIGHLISSIAVVAAFLLLASVFDVTQYEWLARYVAGVLLIALGLRELTGRGHHHGHGTGDDGHDHDDSDGHSHGDADPSAHLTSVTAGPSAPPGHEHSHGDHSHPDGDHRHPDGDHRHPHDDGSDRGWLHRFRHALPIVGHSHDGHSDGHDGHSHDHDGHSHDHDGHSHDHDGHSHDHDGHSHFGADGSESLGGLAVAAFALGFAHEEEFQILGFCTGATQYCLPLMLIYALAVIVALVALTLLLVAGFEHFEEDVEEYADYFPYLSGGVLVLMGIGFLIGVL